MQGTPSLGGTAVDLQAVAEQALQWMRAAGFEHAQVTASQSAINELNVNHNQPSLLRSTQADKLALLGVVDGRVVSTELSDLAPESARQCIAGLMADARSAPQDAANAVSGNQRLRLTQGPQECDLNLLADKMAQLLAFRAQETPKMMVDEADAKHTLVRSRTLTSGGSDLDCSIGHYAISMFGTARDGKRSSSFNAAGGTTHDLASVQAQDLFGIGQMMRDTQAQIETEPIGEKFAGDVLLSPAAVESLLKWLLGHLGDTQLIAGSSLYREQVGQSIASDLLTITSRFDAPGVAAVSADAFVTAPLALLRAGKLLTLTPSLYGSRKTGLAHVPVAGAGWEMAAGNTPVSDMISATERGAIVGRLSMGNPAANGDFSGVIKNSFAVRGGQLGPALSETMISGNMAQMLRNILSVSRERIDTGLLHLPWLQIAGMAYS